MNAKFFISAVLALGILGIGIVLFLPKERTTPIKPPAEIENVITLDSPVSGETISSPLTVRGKARGTWFFEATFPFVLVDWDGKIIAQSYATAQGEWMTEEYVLFEGAIEFEKPEYSNRGALILQKSNPSGLPEHDAALEIPIVYK